MLLFRERTKRMRYRRARYAGGTYFFTLNLADRTSTLLTSNIDALRDAMRYVQARRPFDTVAIVVLPEHLHTVWTLPRDDADFATRWALIKAGFSRNLPKLEDVSASRRTKGERGIWQRRYWEHLIRDERDLARHVDYIHFNPVKHGHVRQAARWPYSSIHRYIKEGVLALDWAYASPDSDGEYGE
jgi:putative transposase